MKNPIVSVDYCEHLQDPINYSRCHFGNADRGYQIKGARTFDIKTKFSDTNSPLPNTVPKPEAFATACRKNELTTAVKLVYDTKGIYSSPRAWWLLRSWDMRRFGTRWRLARLDKGRLC
jgi:thiosulfate/3-mercaptopyruvate sulfurtransferase